MTTKKAKKTTKKQAQEMPENPPIDEKTENEAVQEPEQKTTQDSTEPPNGPETENIEAEIPENAAETSKSDNETETEVEEEAKTAEPEQGAGVLDKGGDLDAEPEIEAAQRINQCPRCKHVSGGRAFVFPGVNRQSVSGVWGGKPYQVIETRRIKCEKCGQVHFVKRYV